MKKWFLLSLILTATASAQELNVEYPELLLPSGRLLTYTRVLKFDGETFQIENVNGAARIPWASMPADWQAKFPRDPERALKIAALEKRIAQMEAAQKTAAAHPVQKPSGSPVPQLSSFGTVMELPRYNLETTLEDLKVGITQEKLLRILGNPRAINGEQWCYPTGQVYVRDGKVVALQNYYGKVFAADYK